MLASVADYLHELIRSVVFAFVIARGPSLWPLRSNKFANFRRDINYPITITVPRKIQQKSYKRTYVGFLGIFLGFWLDSRCHDRLRVVSNFGDGDCGAGEIHTCARKFEETRALSVVSNFRRSLRVASPRTFARACVFHPPHNRHRQN